MLTFFFKISLFPKKVLDPDQAQRSVGPNLGPNCLKKSAEDNKRSPQEGIAKIDNPKHEHAMIPLVLPHRIPYYFLNLSKQYKQNTCN